MALWDIADADATALVYEWLTKRRADLVAETGETGLSVSGVVEGPWPHIRVSPAGITDFRRMAGASLVEDVMVEVYGAPEGYPSSAKLRRILLAAVRAIVALEVAPPEANGGMGVVKEARPLSASTDSTAPAAAVTNQTLISGQTVWRATIEITIGPPTAY